MIPQSQEIFVAEKQIKITWLRGTISKKTLGNIGDESKLILYNLGSHMEGMYIIAVIFVGCDFLQRQGAARFYVGLPYPQVALDNDISSTNHT
jgi:hypothetical protein